MIGDSLNRDIAGARAAGIRTIWINRYNRTLTDSHPVPDIELTDLRDLPTLLCPPANQPRPAANRCRILTRSTPSKCRIERRMLPVALH